MKKFNFLVLWFTANFDSLRFRFLGKWFAYWNNFIDEEISFNFEHCLTNWFEKFKWLNRTDWIFVWRPSKQSRERCQENGAFPTSENLIADLICFFLIGSMLNSSLNPIGTFNWYRTSYKWCIHANSSLFVIRMKRFIFIDNNLFCIAVFEIVPM